MTAPRAGKFDREAANKLPNDIRARLGAGDDVEFSGEVLAAANFREEPRPGLSVVISGDTAEQSIETECDLLVHEATFLESHSDIANEHLHSTAAGAARTALKCKATHLALTHYSARLEQHGPAIAEAGDIHDLVIACGDGDRLVLNDDNSLQHLVIQPEGWMTC